MRSKEDAIDYRYFTDPNLPPIKIEREWIEEIRGSIPKLHNERFSTYTKEYSINEKDAYTIVRDKKISDYYEECLSLGGNPVKVSNWITGNVLGYLNRCSQTIDDLKMSPKMLVDLINLIDNGSISSKQGKEVLEKVLDTGKEPKVIVEELGISQITSLDEIRKIVLEVISENMSLVEDYKNGKRVFDYFIGQIMKKTRGRVNPTMASKILKEELDK